MSNVSHHNQQMPHSSIAREFLQAQGSRVRLAGFFRSVIPVMAVPLVAACASNATEPYKDASQADAGFIEFVNKDPNQLLSITVFDNAKDCRGAKQVALLEKFERKSIRAEHRPSISVRLTYTQKNSEKFGFCGGIYSLPFQQGHLRIIATYLGQSNQCQFHFGSSLDRSAWQPTPDPKKRVTLEPVLNDGASCQNSDG